MANLGHRPYTTKQSWDLQTYKERKEKQRESPTKKKKNRERERERENNNNKEYDTRGRVCQLRRQHPSWTVCSDLHRPFSYARITMLLHCSSFIDMLYILILLIGVGSFLWFIRLEFFDCKYPFQLWLMGLIWFQILWIGSCTWMFKYLIENGSISLYLHWISIGLTLFLLEFNWVYLFFLAFY